jgi:hypothetical protein
MHRDLLFRCSSIGRLMTEPKTQKEGLLSVGARTYIRELVSQDIYGVDFEVSAKVLEKGTRCEVDSIALLNRVRGLQLVKNTERRSNEFITGECDLFDQQAPRGHDLKTAWSIKTFPICEEDCKETIYEWQCRGYMWLWNCPEWEVNYCLVNTPEDLIGYEPQSMHMVDHIPEHHRVTTWTLRRDPEKEALMAAKVKAARDYYAEVIATFDRQHLPLAAELIAA